MALDVGRIEASLGAVVEDAGFLLFDKKVQQADRKKAQAQLGFDLDDRKLNEFELKVKRADKMRAEGTLDLDKSAFDRAVKEGEAQLARLQRRHAKAVLDFDTRGIARASGEIAVLERQLGHLRGQATVNVDDTGLRRFTGSLGRSEGGVNRFNRAVTFMRNALRVVSFSALIAGAAAATTALGALGGAIAGLLGSLGSLSGALVAVPAGISALVQTVGTGMLGLRGIGDTVGAAMESSSSATQDASAAAEQNRATTQRLSAANRDAEDAQEALNKARQQARLDLRALRLEEEGAALSVAEARKALAEARQDQSLDPLEVERRALDLREARARLRNTRTDRRQNEAGLSPAVIQAEERFTEATKQANEASREASRGMDQVSASASKLQEELAKLSPAGRQFARFLISLKPHFDELRNVAQKGLLPGLERGIRSAMGNFGALGRIVDVTAQTMGRAGERFGNFLGRKDVGKDLELIGTRNARLMDRAARATQNLFSALRHVLIAAGPFLDWLTKTSVGFSRLVNSSARAGRETGKMARFFDRTRQTMQRLGSILQSVGAGLLAVGSAAKRYLGDFLLKELDKVAQKFENFTESTEGQNRMRDFFLAMRRPLMETAGLIGDIVAAMLRLSVQPGFTEMVRKLRELVPVMEATSREMAKAFGPAVIDTIASIVKLFGSLAGVSGPLTVFVRTIGAMADGLRWLLDHGGPLRHVITGLGSGLAAFAAINFAASILGLTKLTRAMIGLTGAEKGTTLGQFLLPKIRAFGPRVRAAIGRLFGGRVLSSTVAGAGEQAGAEFGAAATGRLGKLKGRMRAAGVRLGAALISGLALAAAGVGIGWLLAEFLNDKTDGKFRRVGRQWIESIVNGMASAADAVTGTINKIIPGDKFDIGSVGRVDLSEDGKGAKTPAGTKGPIGAQVKKQQDRDEKEVKKTRPRKVKVQTVTVDPVVGIAGLPTARGIRRQMDRAADVVRKEFAQLSRLLERQAKRLDDPFRNLRLLRGRDPLGLEAAIRRSGEDSEGIAKRWARRIGEAFESISRFARIEGRETGIGFAAGLNASARTAEDRVQKMRDKVVSDFRAISRIGSAESRELIGNLRATFGRLPSIVQGPTADMLRIVASALRGLGAGGVARVSATAKKIEAKARGGFIGGSGRQDTVYDEVPPGTLILNRHQQPFVEQAMAVASSLGVLPQSSLQDVFTGHARGGEVAPVMVAPGEAKVLPHEQGPIAVALHVANQLGFSPYGSISDLVQSETRPHYAAQGGVVPKPLGQEVRRRLVPAEAEVPKSLVQRVIQRFARGGVVPAVQKAIDVMTERFPLTVTATTGGRHAKDSHHYSGHAVDLSGPPDVMDRAAAFAKRRFGGSLLEGIHNPNLSIQSGKTVSPSFWGAKTWAGHINHIHLALGGAGEKLAGLGKATATRIKTTVKGKTGAVKDLVSGAVGKVATAANKRMKREASDETGPSSPGKKAPAGKVRTWLTKALKLTDHYSPANLNALFGRTMQESAGNPRAVNRWDSNAKAGHPSKGLLQTIDSTFDAHKMKGHGNIFNPVDNAIAAIRYMYKQYGHIVGPSGSGYAKGGFVGRVVQRFAEPSQVQEHSQHFASGRLVRRLAQTFTAGDRQDERTQHKAGGGLVRRLLRSAAEGDRVDDRVEAFRRGGLVRGLTQNFTEGDERVDRAQHSVKGGVIRKLAQSFIEGGRRDERTQRFAKGGTVRRFVRHLAEGDGLDEREEHLAKGGLVQRVVRSVVEGDRVQELVSRFQRGGLVRRVASFAKGGRAAKRKGAESVGAALPFARQIWRQAKSKLGASKLPMPRFFSLAQGTGGTVGPGKSGLDRMTLAPGTIAGLAQRDPKSLLIYLHELAHVFQTKTDEGNAQAFARSVAPRIAKALRVPYDRSIGAGDYVKETRRARRRGRESYLHKQFGLDKKGRPTKKTQKLRKDIGVWYEHFVRGGFVGAADRIAGYAKGGIVGRAVQAFAKGGKVVGASQFGGPKDPKTGHVGKYGELRGTDSFAELDMGKALGKLAPKHPLRITYKGRSVVARKRDIGTGGGRVKGKRRAIDLWYETAKKLRFPFGTDLVTVEPVKKAEKKETPQARKQEQKTRARGGFVGAVQRFAQPVARAVQSFARGGFVAPVIQALARGGVVKASVKDTPPAGAKTPSQRKAGRRKGGTVRLKPFRPGKVSAYIPSSLQAPFDQIWNAELPTLEEDYSEYAEDADLVQEEFLVDPPSGGTQTVDWSAVRIRIAELDGLLARAAVVQDKLVKARDLAVRMIDELKAVAKAQLERVAAIYRRLTENIERLKRLKSHLKNERHKKGKHRDQGTINHIENLIRAIQDQNQELGGTRDQLPSDWMNASEDSALGKIASIVTTVSDGLSPTGEGPAGKLIEIQGLTGRSGKLDDWGDTIRQWTAEKLDLQPGGKLVTPVATDATDTGVTAAQDIRNFIAQIGQLQKDFAPNFRPLLNFAGGGRVNRPLGEPVNAMVHGGELVVDPRTGAITVTVKQEKSDDKSRTVNVVNNFAAPPPDKHTWAMGQLSELKDLV